MRARLSRQEPAHDCAIRELRQGGPGSMVGSVRYGSQRKTVRTARRGSKDCQLCNAVCLRAPTSIPDRRVDRKGFETTIFSAEKKSHRAAASRVLRNIFWRTWRLRAAIPVSSCANGVAKGATACEEAAALTNLSAPLAWGNVPGLNCKLWGPSFRTLRTAFMTTADMMFAQTGTPESLRDHEYETRTILLAILVAILIHLIVAFFLAAFGGIFSPATPVEDKPAELTFVDLSAAAPKNSAFV